MQYRGCAAQNVTAGPHVTKFRSESPFMRHLVHGSCRKFHTKAKVTLRNTFIFTLTHYFPTENSLYKLYFYLLKTNCYLSNLLFQLFNFISFIIPNRSRDNFVCDSKKESLRKFHNQFPLQIVLRINQFLTETKFLSNFYFKYQSF